ncbi:helix-turn-helix domain-containing protein [Phytomonospora sp. NPDC050363]|uniref:ArsR/SmtB family transcription factor n=1 Tax=Phytomonospora sp. NPDC050363 TaxID=3155642 RepID=UPI0034007993
MLRINFTGEDIARTRIAAAPDPLWELVCAVHMLRGQRGDLLFAEWRRSALAGLRRPGTTPGLRLFSVLTPTFGYFPDFLNPAEGMRGIDHGLEAVRSTPIPLLVRDLRRLAPDRAHPDLPALASGDPGALTRLTDGMRLFHDTAIAPHRRALEAAFDRDRARRAAAMAEHGVEGLLASLAPTATWSAGELRVPNHPRQEIDLGGRGLLLVPSYFCIRHPMTLFDESHPPVLIYPIARSGAPSRASRGSLPALIGQTRAAVLDTIGAGGSTTELARRVGVSPASASEHARVLRDAGLVASQRDGGKVVHRLTPLGRSLLDSN